MAQVGVISFLLKNVSCVQFLSDWWTEPTYISYLPRLTKVNICFWSLTTYNVYKMNRRSAPWNINLLVAS
jgi:hypothetical protein